MSKKLSKAELDTWKTLSTPTPPPTHSFELEDEIVQVLAKEMASEIDKEILKNLMANVTEK